MNARDIVDLLSTKHSKDLFIPECKDGPTWGASHLRLDAWALTRSWASPCSYGYEIKVSRSDWMQDDKVQYYLSLCHRMHIVCPSGLIKADEVPDGMGLMWVSKTGSRLYTKVKAPYREIEWPVDLMLYVLFSRVDITEEREGRGDSTDYWRGWLEKKREKREIGYRVGRELRSMTDELKRERDNAVSNYERVKAIEERLAAIGLGYLSLRDRPEDIKHRVAERVTGPAARLRRDLTGTIANLSRTRDAIDAVIEAEMKALEEDTA